MRAALQFAGLMALGLILAVSVAAMGGQGSLAKMKASSMLDLGPFASGLATGLLLSALTRVDWTRLPRQAIAWLLGNVRNLQLGTLAAACLAVILFY